MKRLLYIVFISVLWVSLLAAETLTERFFQLQPYEKIQEDLRNVFSGELLSEEDHLFLQTVFQPQDILSLRRAEQREILHQKIEAILQERISAQQDISSLSEQHLQNLIHEEMKRLREEKVASDPLLMQLDKIHGKLTPFFTERDFFLFKEIVQREDHQLIGYHGASRKFRIFQDCLHVLFEEVLQIKVPENFYFLRVPGEKYVWSDDTPTETFLNPVHTMSPRYRDAALQFFVFNAITRAYGVEIKAADFTENELEEMGELIYIDSELMRREVYHRPVLFPELGADERPKDTPQLANVATILARHIDVEKDEIHTLLTNELSYESVVARFPSKIFPFYYYHLHHFIESLKGGELEREPSPFVFDWYDSFTDSQQRVISINAALFSNCSYLGESTLGVYIKDRTIERGDAHCLPALERFLETLGISPELARALFKRAEEILDESEMIEHGVILQLFDRSESPFFLADRVSYLSGPVGIPIEHVKEIPTSTLLTGQAPLLEYLTVGNGSPIQIRLLMDNATVLSPYRGLEMVRYDKTPPEISQNVLLELRSLVREVEFDVVKRDAYLQKLHSWRTL